MQTPVPKYLSNKTSGLQFATLLRLRRNSPVQVFSSEFYEILLNNFLIEQLQLTGFRMSKDTLKK